MLLILCIWEIVAGEKIVRTIERSVEKSLPLIVVSASAIRFFQMRTIFSPATTPHKPPIT